MTLINDFKSQQALSDDNNKGTGIDCEAIEMILKNKLSDSQSNIAEDYEPDNQSNMVSNGEASPGTANLTKQAEHHSFKQSEVTLNKSEVNLQPTQIISLGNLKKNSNKEPNDQDADMLKKRIKLEYQKYDEFVREAKTLGIDLSVF